MTSSTNRATRNDQIIRKALVAHGSVCACGCGAKLSQGDYHWHHNPQTAKRSKIAGLRRSTVAVLTAELAKCVPMLPSCHLQGQHNH